MLLRDAKLLSFGDEEDEGEVQSFKKKAIVRTDRQSLQIKKELVINLQKHSRGHRS